VGRESAGRGTVGPEDQNQSQLQQIKVSGEHTNPKTSKRTKRLPLGQIKLIASRRKQIEANQSKSQQIETHQIKSKLIEGN
jgi:hypothetical protein